MESMHQPIIPGLPDDLGLRCLAMLSHGHHGVAETVSKRWRDVIRSEEYSNFKAREGWCGDWLFVLTAETLTQWIAYDPGADRWHPLPPRTHHLQYGMNYFGCHCVSNMFLVIGGRYWWNIDSEQRPPCIVSNEVFRFDPFKKEWSKAASMRTPRFYFASCTLDGKIYVAGGWNYSDPEGMNLAEVYDPLTNRWEDLPPMPLPAKGCTGIAYKGKFHVINFHVDDEDLYHHTAVFDPLSRSWNIKHESWFSRTSKVAATVDQVYTISELDGSIVRRDAEKDEWNTVGEVPPLFHLNGPQLREVFDYGLAALGHELYAIGGKDYWINDWGDEEEENLDRVRVCDPRCSPLIWRETRPMCLNASGGVMGWASLKQQQ